MVVVHTQQEVVDDIMSLKDFIIEVSETPRKHDILSQCWLNVGASVADNTSVLGQRLVIAGRYF